MSGDSIYASLRAIRNLDLMGMSRPTPPDHNTVEILRANSILELKPLLQGAVLALPIISPTTAGEY